MIQKKRFLLAAPENYKMYDLIVKNLSFLGFDVSHIEDHGYSFGYKSWKDRLYNFYRKVVHGDRNYKNVLRRKFIKEQQLKIISEQNYYDHSLVIRADFFDEEVIHKIREKSKHSISFHYDGVGRAPQVLTMVDMFDSFYVFDPLDINRYKDVNLRYSPNFYFDYTESPQIENRITKGTSVFYVSTYHPSRIDILILIHQTLKSWFDDVQFIVLCNQEYITQLPSYVVQEMKIQDTYITFEEQMQHNAQSALILDLVIDEHVGFSFRIFEGLKYKRKIITTNLEVLKADFYHPNNIYVIVENNLNGLAEFLELDYFPLPEAVIEQYSFTNWLNSKIKEQGGVHV